MRNTMFKTVLALALSAGLVACVADDASVDTEELAENPDVLPDDNQGDQVDPTGVNENPGTVPGRTPAPVQGRAHIPISGQMTTDTGVNRPNGTQGEPVVTDETAQDLPMHRGSVETSHVDGDMDIGTTCEGQEADCRIAAPSLSTQRR
jgi:hypothetical protein